MIEKLVAKNNSFRIPIYFIGELRGEPVDIRNYLRRIRMKTLCYIDNDIKIMDQNLNLS